MNSATIHTAIAFMVLGIVSASFCMPVISFSFFRWLPGMLIVLVSLACGILAIVVGVRVRVLRLAGRAIVDLVLGIIGTSISGFLLLCLLSLRVAFRAALSRPAPFSHAGA